MQLQKCFLLSYIKYGDNDAVLHCYTLENGYQSFFAKGIYAARNKKKPYLLPLNLISISTAKKISESSIARISKIEVDQNLIDFNKISMSSVLFFISDFLNQVLRDEGSNARLFQEIEVMRTEIFNDNLDAYLVFVFRFLMISGVAPLQGENVFLNPESGMFEKEISHSYFNQNISILWKRFLDTENIYSIKLKRGERSDFLDSLMIYCQFHITGFHIPRSLAVVREIFE